MIILVFIIPCSSRPTYADGSLLIASKTLLCILKFPFTLLLQPCQRDSSLSQGEVLQGDPGGGDWWCEAGGSDASQLVSLVWFSQWMLLDVVWFWCGSLRFVVLWQGTQTSWHGKPTWAGRSSGSLHCWRSFTSSWSARRSRWVHSQNIPKDRNLIWYSCAACNGYETTFSDFYNRSFISRVT